MKNNRIKIEAEINDEGYCVSHFLVSGAGADLAILLASAIMALPDDEKAKVIAVLTTACDPMTLMASALGVSNVETIYNRKGPVL